mgnify:CR=1 FL=1
MGEGRRKRAAAERQSAARMLRPPLPCQKPQTHCSTMYAAIQRHFALQWGCCAHKCLGAAVAEALLPLSTSVWIVREGKSAS